MRDTYKVIGNSRLQHGKNSNRIYLMKLDLKDLPAILPEMEKLAFQNNYSKIFVRVPLTVQPVFEKWGYLREAMIPGYYRGKRDAIFMARFLDPQRAFSEKAEKIADVLAIIAGKMSCRPARRLADSFHCRRLAVEDIPALAALYREVFTSYPFPIQDEGYLKLTMRSNVVYYGIFEKDRLVAASSAECDFKAQSAEMTDFATTIRSRNRGFARCLLDKMESEAEQLNIRTGYTIARARSAGINITFARAGYTFDGTLVNNTQISGRIESMNVWHKRLW